jgi:hypothetical protein
LGRSRGDRWMLADVTKGVTLSWWDLGFLHDIPSHLRDGRTRTREAWHMGEMVTSLSSQTILSESPRGVKGDPRAEGHRTITISLTSSRRAKTWESGTDPYLLQRLPMSYHMSFRWRILSRQSRFEEVRFRHRFTFCRVFPGQ